LFKTLTKDAWPNLAAYGHFDKVVPKAAVSHLVDALNRNDAPTSFSTPVTGFRTTMTGSSCI